MCVYELYEKKDGSGPLGIKGDKIYEFSKIVSICNAYVKYISDEKGILPHVALERITAEAGNSYDEEIYKDFINTIYCYPNGLSVKLNNGQDAVVIAQNKDSATRPIVQVKEDGKYYVIMSAVSNTLPENYEREVFYQYGKLLLEQREPVLKEYLIRERDLRLQVMNTLIENPTENARERQKQVRKELEYIEESLSYYCEY
jgi:hypothetical protein